MIGPGHRASGRKRSDSRIRRRSRQTRECLRALSVRFDGSGGWSESQARWFELKTEDQERLLGASLWLPAT
jgi:hypothetical protein